MEEGARRLPKPFSRYGVTAAGVVYNMGTGREMGRKIGRNGYVQTGLMADGRGLVTIEVHRLVAMAFLQDYAAGLEVNHKDGDRLNNAAGNLEMVTHEQNMRHACFVLGKTNAKRGRPLTREEVLAIREDRRPLREIAEEYSISKAMACAVRRGTRCGGY